MSTMMASDFNNPKFMGAMNPDQILHAEFYWHEPEDVHKSEAAGKVVRLEKMPYVRIQLPGDHTSIMECPVTEDHKRRWPDRWLYWQIKEGLVDGAQDIPGWKIEEWTHLNPDQVRELKFMRFSVVEQIANASDAQVNKIGMGGLALRQNARQALHARMGAEVRDEMQKKDAEISALKQADAEKEERLKKMEAFMAQMLASADKAGEKAAQTLSVKRG